jgi:hypothetical protein
MEGGKEEEESYNICSYTLHPAPSPTNRPTTVVNCSILLGRSLASWQGCCSLTHINKGTIMDAHDI